MAITHTSFTAARDWLLQMGAGAAEHNVTLQYCMSLPRHVLQSAGISGTVFDKTGFVQYMSDLRRAHPNRRNQPVATAAAFRHKGRH